VLVVPALALAGPASASRDLVRSWPGSFDVIADDGTVVVPNLSGQPFTTRSTPGSGRVLSTQGPTASAGATAPPITQETVFGLDRRVQDRDTRQFPDRAVVFITFSDGFQDFGCTGWMVGRDAVATAGHCVDRGGGEGFYDRASYRISPGQNGFSTPFGVCRAERLLTNRGWHARGAETHDYGGIDLSCEDIGTVTGTFGVSLVASSAQPLVVRGYPGDKDFGTQWVTSDCSDDARRARSCGIEQTTERQVFYLNDSIGGMSGSPVYQELPWCGVCAVGIHAYGAHGSAPPHDTYNHGARIGHEALVFLVILSSFEAPPG
jgi:glutamyl endopeptidase